MMIERSENISTADFKSRIAHNATDRYVVLVNYLYGKMQKMDKRIKELETKAGLRKDKKSKKGKTPKLAPANVTLKKAVTSRSPCSLDPPPPDPKESDTGPAIADL